MHTDPSADDQALVARAEELVTTYGDGASVPRQATFARFERRKARDSSHAERRIRARNSSSGVQGGRALISQFWRFGQPRRSTSLGAAPWLVPGLDPLAVVPGLTERVIVGAGYDTRDDVQPAAFGGLPHHFLVVRDDVRGRAKKRVSSLRCVDVAHRNVGEESIGIHQE